ncbi:hypothetical protein E2C01_025469 [Portunus trituberculatus]|uniref:Uncharacterized protein n=1 Tax=Portunus trituberculatus TaxID=210409 RepID=A0A5B7EGI6_PORTR|nr:hypothetical protein [Portunus trituberculatus]
MSAGRQSKLHEAPQEPGEGVKTPSRHLTSRKHTSLHDLLPVSVAAAESVDRLHRLPLRLNYHKTQTFCSLAKFAIAGVLCNPAATEAPGRRGMELYP